MNAPEGGDGDAGTVYLLHFQRPYRHARHYLGWTSDLPRRVAQHRRGLSGARLMEVVHAAGIAFVVARTWPGDRTLERRKKGQGGRGKMCPICKLARQAEHAYPELAGAA